MNSDLDIRTRDERTAQLNENELETWSFSLRYQRILFQKIKSRGITLEWVIHFITEIFSRVKSHWFSYLAFSFWRDF